MHTVYLQDAQKVYKQTDLPFLFLDQEWVI